MKAERGVTPDMQAALPREATPRRQHVDIDMAGRDEFNKKHFKSAVEADTTTIPAKGSVAEFLGNEKKRKVAEFLGNEKKRKVSQRYGNR